MSPLQANYRHDQYYPVLKCAVEKGINFYDTAQLYDAYPLIKCVLDMDKNAVISSKSYAYDTAGAVEAVEQALREMGRDYIDIFYMHEQESYDTLRGHHEALEAYVKLKKQGKIRAIGMSSHYVQGVLGANSFNEIEIVHPMINFAGFGIVDGGRTEMESAIRLSKQFGKGIVAMKIFGGGHLLTDRIKAIEYAAGNSDLDSLAIGMMSAAEITSNINLLEGTSAELPPITQKKVAIMDWCVLCGKCIKKCPQNAMIIDSGRVIIDRNKCVLCGYCGSACKDMCIKIY